MDNMASDGANDDHEEFPDYFSADKDILETDTTPFLNSVGGSDLRKPLLIQYDAYHNTTIAQPLPLNSSKDNINFTLFAETAQWKLNYQDFCPNIQYTNTISSTDTFCDLVENANCWLRQNPQISVRSCETICWWTTCIVEVGDTEAVLLRQNKAPFNDQEQTIYYIGLRLWLLPSNKDEAPLQIGFRDTFHHENKGLSKLIEKCKEELKEDPIQGSIITIETTFCPQIEDENNITLLWKQNTIEHSEYSVFLRIFYRILEESANEEIGSHDFCPELIGERYEPFGSLVKKATKWCSESKNNVQITNLKSLYVLKSKDPPPNEESSDYISYCSFNCLREQYFQHLRAFFVIRPTTTDYKPINFNYITFSPVQLSIGTPTSVQYEKMQQTMIRVQAWISASEAKIFGIESITTPLISHSTSQSLPEITYWEPSLTSNNCSIQKWLIHIRVFLDGSCKIPDPALLLPLPSSLINELERENYDQEERYYYSRKKKRKRTKSIAFLVCVFALLSAVIIILLDQGFHFINL